MKAIIESNFSNMNVHTVGLFVEILNTITSCSNEDELRFQIRALKNKFINLGPAFNIGFGRNHMWVCEAGKKERLIFVEF